MKKVTLILAALALVLGITQCKKQEKPAQIGEKQHIVLTANNGNDGSKVAVESATTKLNLTWEGDETINVSGGATGTLHYVSGEGATATFEGDIEIVSGELIEFHVGSLPVNYEGQAGTDVGLKSLIHLKGTSAYEDDGEYSALMELQFAVLKLDVSALGTEGELKIIVGGETIASVSDVASSEGKTVFVAVPANENPTQYTFKIGENTDTKPWPALKPNTFYMMDAAGHAIVVNPELLPGKFSVNATEYVKFSKGNLFCIRSGSEGSYTYSFGLESNQYDFRTRPGYYAVKNGVPMAMGTGSDESGLFQYDLSCAVDGGDFGAFGMNYPIVGDPSQIMNFGKAIGPEWYTLTQSEWNYLLAEHESVWCKVKGIYGYAFAPDGYDTTTQPWTTTGNELNNWDEAESAGVLFIPAAGFMQGEGVNFGIVYADGSVVPFSGYSWTSTANGTEGAWYMGFGEAEIGTYVHVNSYAFPERLVQKFEKPQEQEYVDLGLPSGLKWAMCNLGASKPEEYGDYYAWGATTTWYSAGGQTSSPTWKEGYSDGYVWPNCPGNGGSSDYNADAFSTWKADNLTGGVLNFGVDAVAANWGGGWRMPTTAEWKELYDNTYCSTWTTENGVAGRKFTSKKDSRKYIFLPAAGDREDSRLNDVGSLGYYWSSSLFSSNLSCAYVMCIDSDNVEQRHWGRYRGLSVRPVYD